MRGLFVKLIGILLILSIFSSCMTVSPENRSEAVNEFRKLRTVSISRVPLENALGPVFRISAPSNNAVLMVAGQTGMELDYKYFVIIDSGSNQYVSGYIYQGTGGVSTSTVYSITIAFTNDEDLELKYNVYECSSLLDGYRFVTHSGEITLWTLFGATLVGGGALMLSSVAVNYDDPRWEEKFTGRMIGGTAVMISSILFTIPLW